VEAVEMNGGRIVRHKKHDNDILVQIKCFGKYEGRDQGKNAYKVLSVSLLSGL
jgi:hypothetical protein